MTDEPNAADRSESGRRSRARLGYVLAGLGLGGVLASLFARQLRRGREAVVPERITGKQEQNFVDDRGTDQHQAAQILRNLRDRGFEASDEKVAVALGRTAEEIEAFSSGRETIDDDVIMKARGIAMHRGIRIE